MEERGWKARGRKRIWFLYLLRAVLDGVRGLDLEGDGLASQSLNENLHFRLCLMTLVYTGNEGKLACTAILRALTQY